MLDSYAKLIRQKKIDLDVKYAPIQRLIKRIKQKKDELVYGLIAALIMESIVRLIVYLMVSMHSERGTCKIPRSIAMHMKKETITASELGSAMKTDEPNALMILNTLELLGVVCIADEFSRTFKKTGKTSIPNVLGMYVTTRGEAVVASSVFHRALHKDLKCTSREEWIPNRELMRKLYEKFLEAHDV